MPAPKNRDGIFNVLQNNQANESLSRPDFAARTDARVALLNLPIPPDLAAAGFSGDLSGFGTAVLQAMLDAHQSG